MKNVGVMFMTALIPTVGHKYLIDFARNFLFPFNAEVHVIISTRSTEPNISKRRINTFLDEYVDSNAFFHEHFDDNAPQNPDGSEEFWQYWKHVVEQFVHQTPTHFFASEPYGKNMADLWPECKFIPVDIKRETFPVKGTEVRQNINKHWNDILPSFKKELQKNIVIFGAESVGKTTLAKKLANEYYQNARFVHEWARPYLEAVGPEITEEKMLDICHGERSVIELTRNDLSKRINFYDTDLLSTLGYYRIWGRPTPHFLNMWCKTWLADHYIVLDTNLPFEPDQLRYGENKRESDTKFWTDILDEFGASYTVVQDREKINTYLDHIIWDEDYMELVLFERE